MEKLRKRKKNKMRSLNILIVLAAMCGCVKKSVSINDAARPNPKADSLFSYHILQMENYVSEGQKMFGDCDSCGWANQLILESIIFLSDNTGIPHPRLYKGFTGAGYYKMKDAVQNLKEWRAWYAQRKGRLRWNEKLQKVELIE